MTGSSDRRYGDMNGPTEAEVGDTINVSFTTPPEAVSVKFEAMNAIVGFVGPMPLTEITAETSARMMVEGSATIFGTAYDDSGLAVHQASHVVQVRARRDNSPRSLTDIAADMQRKMEEKIMGRLKGG